MHKYKQLTQQIIQQGFALPTLIIAGTILMIVGVSTLVASTSITKTLQDQQWNRLADEAAQAGVAFATSCLEDNKTNYWTNPLKPSSACTGTSGSGGVVVQESGKWTSTFTVSVPTTTGASEPPTATASGIVTLVASGRTYTSNKTVIVNVSQTLSALGSTNSAGSNFLSDGYSYYLTSITGFGEGICTIASNSQAYCAGRNNTGQLGIGSTVTPQIVPVKFNLGAGLTAKSVVAYGQTAGLLDHVCVLASNAQVYCAGSNSSGQLGNGNTTSQSTPVQFIVPGWGVNKLVTSNDTNTCVIATSNNYLYCAGDNSSGQLGDNSTTARSTPVQFGGANGFFSGAPMIDAVVGSGLTCATSSLSGASKNLICSGQNTYGQLGNGGTTSPVTNLSAYVTPAGNPPQSVVHGSGGYNVCALTTFNAMYCSGGGSSGELGNGATSNQSTPVRFGASLGAIKMGSTSGLHTCALAYSAVAYCAGYNAQGQLGNGNTTNQSTPVQFPLPAFQAATSVMTSFRNTCALSSLGNLYCAGLNDYGQLGNGNTTNQSSPTEFLIPGDPPITQFAVLAQNICATANNQLYCAGRNNAGQLGDGTTTNRSTPVKFQLP